VWKLVMFCPCFSRIVVPWLNGCSWPSPLCGEVDRLCVCVCVSVSAVTIGFRVVCNY
jgi:hypothetical protein